MQLTRDQQQVLSVAVSAYPNVFRPTNERDVLLLDFLAAVDRLEKVGNAYRASDELMGSMKKLLELQAEQAKQN